MTVKNKEACGDRAIGMDASITRRDFLGSALLASSATALNGLHPAQILATAGALSATAAQDDWTGYGGVGEYSRSNGNAFAVMELGHKMRDGAYEPLPPDTVETGETYDCVIVGGGISGKRERTKRASFWRIIRFLAVRRSRTNSKWMENASWRIKDRQSIWFPILTVSSHAFTIPSDCTSRS